MQIRGAIEYSYQILKILRDSPTHINKRKVYLVMNTAPNKIYKVMDYLEEKGLLHYWRKGKQMVIPKPTSEGLNWMKLVEQAMELMDYEEFSDRFRELNY